MWELFSSFWVAWINLVSAGQMVRMKKKPLKTIILQTGSPTRGPISWMERKHYLFVLLLRSSSGQATAGLCYSYDALLVMDTASRPDLLLLSQLQNWEEFLWFQLCVWANRLVDVRRQEEGAGFGTTFHFFWVERVLISLLAFVASFSYGSLI